MRLNELPLYAIDDVDIPINGVNTVNLTITNIPELTSCDAIITYDPNVIEIIGMIASDFSPTIWFTDDKVGHIDILAFTYGVLHGSALVAEIQVKPSPRASINDTCPLTLSGTYIYDNSSPLPVSVPHDIRNGIATIASGIPGQIPWAWIAGGVAIGVAVAGIVIWRRR